MSNGYAIGQRFAFKPGDKVICNGYPGAVVRHYTEGMVEVRLNSGLVCTSASFPNCYPAPCAEDSAAVGHLRYQIETFGQMHADGTLTATGRRELAIARKQLAALLKTFRAGE